MRVSTPQPAPLANVNAGKFFSDSQCNQTLIRRGSGNVFESSVGADSGISDFSKNEFDKRIVKQILQSHYLYFAGPMLTLITPCS
jgi:hypothetical protein